MMRSLSGRLFAAMTALVFVTALVGGGLAFQWSYEEAIDLQDASLIQVGRFAVGTPTDAGAAVGVDREDRITIETPGRLPDRGTDANGLPPIPTDLADGLHTIERGAETWRVLMRTRADGTRLAVSQPTAGREEIARGSALHTVAPIIALVPFLVLLLGLVIRTSLRPVARLAAELDAKRSDHLRILPLDGMPTELVPFVASINGLLGRIAAMWEHERRFIAAAAHEMRTPVTALGLQAENLARTELSVVSRQRLDVLADGIRRIARLLEQLLAASRYEANLEIDRSIVDVVAVAKSVVADFMPQAETRAIDLGFLRAEPVAACIDETALAVLLRNLIDNALRHTPSGGRIDVSVFADGDDARLDVEDTGPGIPPGDLERVFAPFVRGSRPEGEGSGLGLTIVHSILDRAAGSIRLANADPALGTGLKVHVVLRTAGAHPSPRLTWVPRSYVDVEDPMRR